MAGEGRAREGKCLGAGRLSIEACSVMLELFKMECSYESTAKAMRQDGQ